MLSAEVPPDAVDATAARATPTRTTAPMMRALIMGDSPKRIGRRCGSSLGVPVWPTENRRRSRLLVYTTLPRFGTVAQSPDDVKTTFARAEWSTGVKFPQYAACERSVGISSLSQKNAVWY
jgi:hypothetical protein